MMTEETHDDTDDPEAGRPLDTEDVRLVLLQYLHKFHRSPATPDDARVAVSELTYLLLQHWDQAEQVKVRTHLKLAYHRREMPDFEELPNITTSLWFNYPDSKALQWLRQALGDHQEGDLDAFTAQDLVESTRWGIIGACYAADRCLNKVSNDVEETLSLIPLMRGLDGDDPAHVIASLFVSVGHLLGLMYLRGQRYPHFEAWVVEHRRCHDDPSIWN